MSKFCTSCWRPIEQGYRGRLVCAACATDPGRIAERKAQSEELRRMGEEAQAAGEYDEDEEKE